MDGWIDGSTNTCRKMSSGQVHLPLLGRRWAAAALQFFIFRDVQFFCFLGLMWVCIYILIALFSPTGVNWARDVRSGNKRALYIFCSRKNLLRGLQFYVVCTRSYAGLPFRR